MTLSCSRAAKHWRACSMPVWLRSRTTDSQPSVNRDDRHPEHRMNDQSNPATRLREPGKDRREAVSIDDIKRAAAADTRQWCQQGGINNRKHKVDERGCQHDANIECGGWR